MRTEQIQIYKFNELGEEEKETAIQNQRENEFYLDYEWYDYLHEEFKEELNKIGVDCKSFLWDLNSRNEFKAEDLKVIDNQKFLKEVGFINWLVMNELREDKTTLYDIFLNEDGEADLSYEFNNEDDFNNKEYEERQKEADEIIVKIENYFDEKFKEFHNRLQKDYDYLLSDEAIKEYLENNEYEFKKDGSRY